METRSLSMAHFLKKPFIEKPVDSEDHNLWVYYPRSQGGGVRKLFRNVGRRSSEFFAGIVEPRAMGEPGRSYIYEQFIPLDDGEDIHAYAVGPSYCHLETQRSPTVDGLVRRNTRSKEIRYPLSPSRQESEIAKLIVNALGQRVCGFHVLRAGGKSYVTGVHGWRVAKDNTDYYDECAKILRDLFINIKDR